MANNSNPNTQSDDFLDHILSYNNNTNYVTGPDPNLGRNQPGPVPMMLQLGSTGGPYGVGGSGGFPLGLSLDQGNGGVGGGGFGDDVSRNIIGHNLFSDDVVVHSRGASSALNPGFHGQTSTNTVPVRPQQPMARPRQRARRGQATDPHSIAERLRRERIAERVRALQDLVPSVSKTDRATMLDEIVDYVKFLRLQVKVLSMSRLGGAAAVAPLVSDIPTPSVEDERIDGVKSEAGWEKWSKDGTEEQVAKLMEEDVGAAMQFLQSKGLCIMPVSLASAIYPTHTPDTSMLTKPESDSF